MLFQNIAILDTDFTVKQGMYVGVIGSHIAYIGDAMPANDYGRVYDGASRLLMPGFYNAHAHTPMTLLRGYGEGLPLHRWLNERMFPFEAAMSDEDAYWGTLLGLAESMRYGIVSSCDMYNHCEAMARAVLESGMKANIARHVTAFGNEELKDLESFQALDAFRREYNGAGNGRLLTDTGLHAVYTSTPKVARQLAEYAAGTDSRIHMHLSETKKENEDCKAMHGQSPTQYLNGLGLFDVPALAAHCVWLEDEDFDILAEKSVTVATCPVSNLKLASGICNAPKMLEMGVPVAIGTDSVASNNSLDYLEEMKFFALLHKGASYNATAITPPQTLCAGTRTGALAQGRGDCGLLAQGSRADLIVLDLAAPNMIPAHDLAAAIPYSACGKDVLLTMVDGQVLYENGSYLTIDIERVLHEAERVAFAIRDKL